MLLKSELLLQRQSETAILTIHIENIKLNRVCTVELKRERELSARYLQIRCTWDFIFSRIL